MKNIKQILFLIFLFPCLAFSETEKEITTAINMGSFRNWALTGTASRTSRLNQGTPKNGAAPLLVEFRFQPDKNDYLFIENPAPLPGVPKKVRFLIEGDAAGESVRINIVDKNGEFFQAYVTKVDWEGWENKELPLEFSTHWGGDENDMMDPPLSFHSISINSENDQIRREGKLFISQLEFVSVEKSVTRKPSKTTRKSQILLDDFERPNPLTAYQTWTGDISTLQLLSSPEQTKQGNFSMQVSYDLNTTRNVPSWVNLSLTPETDLDWTWVSEISVWVKGDGSRNYFRISFVDEDDNTWVYQNEKVLKRVDWTELKAPIESFKPLSRKKGLSQKLARIKKIEFGIVGEEASRSSGRIWIDNFSAIGVDLNPLTVSPNLPVSTKDIEKTKIQFGDTLHTEFRNTPEFNREFLFYNSLYIRASAKNITLSADIVSQEAEAGKTIPFVRSESTSNDTEPAIEPEESRPSVELAYFNATLQNLHPNLTSLSIGNLYIDYGPDIYSPLFGFKGIQADGNFEDVTYSFFAIKHIYDSFTMGTRLQTNFHDFLLQGMTVIHYDTARSLSDAKIIDGTLQIPSNQEINTQEISSDKTYLADINRSFWEEKLDLFASYGINYYKVDNIKDVSVPAAPVVKNTVITPKSLIGRRGEIRARLNKVPTKGSSLIMGYRHVGTHYKPRFRRDSLAYDTDQADLEGFSTEFTQIIAPFKINLFYEDVDRGANSKNYFRRIFRQSYGVYDINKWDVVFSINQRKEFYALAEELRKGEFFINPNDPKNEKSIFYELFLGHWFSKDFFVWAKFLTEQNRLITQQRRLRKDFFQLQSEWAVFKNAKLTTSIIQTRFDESSFEPFSATGSITTGSLTRLRNIEDNQVKVFLDINF